MYDTDGSVYPTMKTVLATRLTSLSFSPCFMFMKVLLLLLSCTPRLIHLKLIIWTDTTRWGSMGAFHSVRLTVVETL